MKRSVKDGIRHATKMKAVGKCTRCDGVGLLRLGVSVSVYTSCVECDATGRGDIQRQKAAKH